MIRIASFNVENLFARPKSLTCLTGMQARQC
jgi:hypothetical protein